MSLFKARDWWHVHLGEGDLYDKGCLCVANIDASPDETDKVIVGSHSGLLHIFGPKAIPDEDGHLMAFQPDHLLLETQLNFPILHVSVGKFWSGDVGFQLAVLHPRKLCIYALSVNPGAVDHGTNYHLSLWYEHNLQRSAFCLITGPFGGVKGKDLLCVQSLDGALSFYEQDSFAFTRFIPAFLLPGPICYASKVDSFITVSSSWMLEFYRYQTLAVAKDTEKSNEISNPSIVQGKRVVADWTYSLGEAALDIAVIEANNAIPSIYVLGERNLFVFKENGIIRFMKKLDYSPTCFCPYQSHIDGSIMLMMCTQNQTLLVYCDLMLKWAAELQSNPISVQRAKFANLNGVIVVLSDNGSLSCCYLGTDPSLFVAPPQEGKEFNFEEAEKELKDLRNAISSMNIDSLEARKSEKDVVLKATVSDVMNYALPTEDFVDEKDIPVVTVKIRVTAVDINDLRISIDVNRPLAVSQNLFTISSLSGSHEVEVQVQMRDPCLPFSLNFRVHLVYYNPSGQPRVIEALTTLPLKIVGRGCPPEKISSFKLTLDTNKHCVALSELFPEFVVSETEDAANSLGFQYYGGPTVTVLASKTSQRYRFQSSSFSALWLLVQDLVNRLQALFHRNGDFKISFVGSLPLREAFLVIEEHFQARLQKRQIDESLRQRAAQFRVIQKRLLTKMKDKTPTPLNNLDALLEATHQQILYLADSAMENENDIAQSSAALSCACQLLKLLVKLNSAQADESLLDSVFFEQIGCYADEGWEERTEATLVHLLRTCLAKPGKDIPIGLDKLDMLTDLNRLRKHLSVFVDRLTKGSKVQFGSVEEVPEEDEEPLLGSQLAEDKKNKLEDEKIVTYEEVVDAEIIL